MKMLRRFICLAVVLVCATTMAGTSARAAASSPAVLSMLVGTWNCTYVGPKGTQTSSITFTKANDLWLSDTEHDGAYGDRPAHDGAGLLGYDSKGHQYVGMGGSTLPGDFGIGTAKASPMATTMTFVGAYPPDPTHDKTTYTFTSTKITSLDSFTEKGKAMTGHGTCTKQ
jgi:hypothetical protein